MDISNLPNWIITSVFVFISTIAILLLIYGIRLYIKNGVIKIGNFTISRQALRDEVKKDINNNTNNKNEGENYFTWCDLEIGIKELRKKVLHSRFNPTLIVGIGRGGAIVTALLSGSLNHVHFIALEREYDWSQKKRNCKIFDDVKFSKNLERVLLVAGDLVTGGTADVFTKYLEDLGAKEIKFLTFVKVKSAIRIPDYYYKEIDSCDFKLPWMLTDDYIKDSRDEFKC